MGGSEHSISNDGGVVPLPDLQGVTFQAWNSSSNRLPDMRRNLLDLIWNWKNARFGSGSHVHIVHVGTVGDARHSSDNPSSRHLWSPPGAIDIQKIYVNRSLVYDCRYRSGKVAFETSIKGLGGQVLHVYEDDKAHCHLQVLGAVR